MTELPISPRIRYRPATDDPLSADIGIVRTESGVWLFDVGADPRAVEGLDGEYRVVLSHFHADHTANLDRIRAAELYVSPMTLRHTHRGQAVDRELWIDGVHIFALPSSHAKGCLGLEADGFAFVGDGLYSRVRDGFFVFNAQLVYEELRVLRSLQADTLLVSHRPGLVQSRSEAVAQLEQIYALRQKNNPEILVPRGE